MSEWQLVTFVLVRCDKKDEIFWWIVKAISLKKSSLQHSREGLTMSRTAFPAAFYRKCYQDGFYTDWCQFMWPLPLFMSLLLYLSNVLCYVGCMIFCSILIYILIIPLVQHYSNRTFLDVFSILWKKEFFHLIFNDDWIKNKSILTTNQD